MEKKSPAREFALIVALAGLYVLVARASILLAFQDTNASPVWPPSGIAFAAMLVLGVRTWPGIAIGAFTANLWAFLDAGILATTPAIVVSLVLAAGNTLEALAAWWFYHEWIAPRRILDRPRDLMRFTVAVLLACGIAASVGAVSLAIVGLAPGTVSLVVWYTWWLGDVAGILLLTPLAIALLGRWPAVRRSWAERLAFIASLLVAALVVFGPLAVFEPIAQSGAYLLLPFIAWVAIRFEVRGTTATMAVIATASIIGTLNGHGPFQRPELNDALLNLQLYLCILAVFGLLVQATIRHTRQSPEEAVAA